MQIDFKNFMEFFALLGKMKSVTRYEGRWWDEYNLPRHESVPDHVWRMLMMAMYLDGKISIQFDFTKLVKIILVHDIAEIVTGDTNATNPDSSFNTPENKELKEESERKAVNEIFSKVEDRDFANQCIDLWEEYEAGETNEGKVAKCIDKLEAFFYVFETSGIHIYPEHYDFCLRFIDSQKGKIDDFDELYELTKQEFIAHYQSFGKA